MLPKKSNSFLIFFSCCRAVFTGRCAVTPDVAKNTVTFGKSLSNSCPVKQNRWTGLTFNEVLFLDISEKCYNPPRY